MKLILQQYQKHKHLEINLNSFTCIIGQSNTGKTAIFRAIEDLLWNKTKNVDRIMYGKDACSITLEYKNVIVKKVIHRSKPSEFTVNGEVLKKSATKSGSELFAEKGIFFDELNYQNQSRGHFFISESSTTAGNMVSKYANLEEVRTYTDDVIKKELGYINRELTKLEKENNALQKVLTDEVLNDYNLYLSKINELNELGTTFTTVQSKVDSLKQLIKLHSTTEIISELIILKTEYDNSIFKQFELVYKYIYNFKNLDILQIKNNIYNNTLKLNYLLNYISFNTKNNIINRLHLLVSDYDSLSHVNEQFNKLVIYTNTSVELNNTILKYNELLNSQQICPTCGQKIN